MQALPLWPKIVYALFLAVLVPAYWRHSDAGVKNFLWFSDIALLVTGAALWLENRLLASTMAVGALAPELFWNASFFTQLLTGKRLTGLTDYMFDARRTRFMRGLSLFHIALPIVLLWLLARLGYDSRGLIAQTLLAWIILPITYAITKPEHNINWVFGSGGRPPWGLAPLVWLGTLMLAFPLLVYLPTHLVLRAIFRA